ncbi:ABC transporter ATP-binding protein [Caldimonas caldifontis]|uniref:ABC transporter ATP-binding protein n=1 Tax=Caldimonas caldifontis TaxID=1452508 RepID=UPI001B809C83|nr:ABC transporter ATP-binding protein [Caldimonas caldifontis]
MSEPILRLVGLAKRYGDTPVFEGVDLELRPGRFIALLGESGVGKSTLLNCMAGLDTPTAGRVELMGQDLAALDEAGRARLRRTHLGFVFQAFHVLPHLSVADNVALPLLLLGRNDPQRVRQALADVGLEGLAERLPAQLSGGQLQRVAIARALVHRPALLLADEPSGNLDPDTAARVMQALASQVREHQAACVLVTHSQAAAAHADRVFKLTPHGLRSLT